jgi:hypothetical protein
MTTAPNPNHSYAPAPLSGDVLIRSATDVAPTVPTIEDVAALLSSKHRYSELIDLLPPARILAEIAEAEDVLMSEKFSDKRDPEPMKVKDPVTGKVIRDAQTGEELFEPKQRTPHDVNTNSVGLAHAALARYNVVYGMIHNLDTLFNSGIHFDLAEKYLSAADDTVGRTLNARRATEAAALVGDEEMFQQYAPLTGWDDERAIQEWEHYTDMRDSLQVRWSQMATDAVSFESDTYNEEGELLPSSAESMAHSLGTAVLWELTGFEHEYNEVTDTAKKVYTKLDATTAQKADYGNTPLLDAYRDQYEEEHAEHTTSLANRNAAGYDRLAIHDAMIVADPPPTEVA